MQKFSIFLEKNFKINIKNKKYCKFRDHCHYTGKYRRASHSICNLQYGVPKEIPIVFHNKFYFHNDHYFMIKKLAEEFGKTQLLREKC